MNRRTLTKAELTLLHIMDDMSGCTLNNAHCSLCPVAGFCHDVSELRTPDDWTNEDKENYLERLRNGHEY